MDILQLKKTISIIGRDEIGEPMEVTVSVKTVLRSVTSVSEAAICWQKHERYLQQLCATGVLASEKIGGQWIIITQDCVNRWGEPLCKLGDLRDER